MSDRLSAVRDAKFEEVFQILDLMRCALSEAGTNYPEPDEPYCVQATLDLIKQGLVGVALRDKKIVGIITLDYGRWPWTHPENKKGYHLYNQHFYVLPGHRHHGTASKLLTFAKAVATVKELPLKLEMTNAFPNADVRDRFARINGFGYTGGVFLRAPKSETL